MKRDQGTSKYGPWRRCSSCGGTCYWHDTAWVCDRCGDEWNVDHNPDLFAPPAEPLYYCECGEVVEGYPARVEHMRQDGHREVSRRLYERDHAR